MANKTRTFIALPVSQSGIKQCKSLQRGLAEQIPNTRWTNITQFHITLHFLGDLNSTEIWQVCSSLKTVSGGIAPFSFCIQGIGCFPNPSHPRVLWAGIDPDGSQSLDYLFNEIRKSLKHLRLYREEKRPYKPHLTLGRIDGGGPDLSRIIGQQNIQDWKSEGIHADKVQVFSSDPGPEGPTYNSLATCFFIK